MTLTRQKKHRFFQVVMAEHICRDVVELRWANGNIQVINSVRGISINGEARGGIRPPLLGYSCCLPELSVPMAASSAVKGMLMLFINRHVRCLCQRQDY